MCDLRDFAGLEQRPELAVRGDRDLVHASAGRERGGGAVRDAVLEDRAEPGDAGRDPDLAEGRVDAGGHAAALLWHDADRGRGERRVDQADAGAAEHEAGDQDGPGRARFDAGHREQAEAGEREPGAEQQAHGDAHAELAGERGDDERQQRHRQEAQAGLHAG